MDGICWLGGGADKGSLGVELLYTVVLFKSPRAVIVRVDHAAWNACLVVDTRPREVRQRRNDNIGGLSLARSFKSLQMVLPCSC